MEFTLEELKNTLEEMGFKNIPHGQLDDFSKDLKRLMKHDIRVLKRSGTLESDVASAATPTVLQVTDQPSKINSSSRMTDSDQMDLRTEEKEKSTSKNAKQRELLWKKLKSDPVRLHSWYKTFWDVHGLK